MKQLLNIAFVISSFLALAQQTSVVDFNRLESKLFFSEIPKDSTLFNSYQISFDILKKTDSIYLDAVNMKFKNVTLNGKKVSYKNDGKKLIIYKNFKPSTENILQFIFLAAPKKAMYFVGWEDAARNQIWTQGQGKYTSNWLPSIDDVNDKIEFDLSFTAPKDYQVISNGKLQLTSSTANEKVWQFNMQKPMSSYLAAVVVGNYHKTETTSASGVPLEMYYYPEDSLKVEPTYRYTKEIFDFLETEIGYAYPWQNYKQVPVHDFLYAGMENTSCTIFSDSYMIDATAFVDKNYVNVNAHELAHQWFGDLVTATSGKHHWLQEGFATYYALLAEKHVFGDDYFYYKLYQYAQELAAQDRLGESTALLDPKSSSITFYKKGAIVLYLLAQKVGSENFNVAVANYLAKYAYKNVETNNFIAEVTQVSQQNLEPFVEKWLVDKNFYYEEIIDTLNKNSVFIQEFLMVDCEVSNAKCDYYLQAPISDEAKRKIISQVPEKITSPVFKNSILVRQAIAQNVTKIPNNLKLDYESLLVDKSYITIEAALFNLWKNFPEDRNIYLNQTQNIIGLPNKNVRLLWLTLALATPNYKPELKETFLDELIGYAAPENNFEIRMQAFTFLESLGFENEELLSYYEAAKLHHNWRLQKFAKTYLNKTKEKE